MSRLRFTNTTWTPGPCSHAYEIPLLGISRVDADAAARRECVHASRAFLAQDFETQVPPHIETKSFRILAPKVAEGDISTGDKFFADKVDIDGLKARLPSVCCVEMEGAAVAQVCFEHQIPLAVVRTISDGADESAAADFPKFISRVASVYSHGILKRVLTGRGSPPKSPAA